MSSEKLMNVNRMMQTSNVRHFWLLAVPSGVYARSKESTKKKLRSDADFTARTTAASSVGVRNLSLVNIEKIAKGLGTNLRDLFSRV
jgi:hypothetical protein